MQTNHRTRKEKKKSPFSPDTEYSLNDFTLLTLYHFFPVKMVGSRLNFDILTLDVV